MSLIIGGVVMMCFVPASPSRKAFEDDEAIAAPTIAASPATAPASATPASRPTTAPVVTRVP